jgi:hypothetical protein
VATEKEPDEGTVGDVFVPEVFGQSAEELEFIGFEGVMWGFGFMVAFVAAFVAFGFGFVGCFLRCLFDFGGYLGGWSVVIGVRRSSC